MNFRYEGQDYSIAIRKVSLFPQGYAAVLTQSILLDEPSVIVADIGGWTVDLMRLDNRIPNASTCRSLELGMIRCLDEIGEQIRRTLGLSMTAAQMESVLRGDAVHINEDARKLLTGRQTPMSIACSPPLRRADWIPAPCLLFFWAAARRC